MRPKLTDAERELFERFEVPRQDWGKLSGRLIAFAHMLVVPAGKHISTPLRLRPFQIRFIRAVYNAKDEGGGRVVRQAILSVARRNGKTLLAAVLLLAHLAGPCKRPNATIVSAATTRAQASLPFRMVADMVRLNPWLNARLKIVDSTKRVVHREDGSYYVAISAEPGAQFGMGIDFVVYDELAQAKSRNLYDALMTSLGSQPDSLMMIISTQAPSDQHLLSELIDYGQRVEDGVIEDPAFVCHCYSVPRDADITLEREWYKANPGLGDYRDLAEMRTAIARAVKIPSEESTIRVLYLNQRVRADSPFLSQSVYDDGKAAIHHEIFRDGRPIYGGLDLSARTDLTALVLAAEADDGAIELMPFAWTPEDTVAARATRDRAPYDAWVRNHFLLTTPGPTINYSWIAQALYDLGGDMNLARVNYDRWRIDILRQALAEIGGFLPLVECGQGYKDMAPCVEAFEELALAGKIRHGGHPLMRWCFANAVIERDAAGNRKLNKAKSYGRIDVAVAAVMAVGAMKASTEPVVDVAAMIA